ncbi:hypothetical protein AAE478_000569 [Parahypoxylon ruwenzoriense]
MSNVLHRASEGGDRGRPLRQDSFDESLLDAAGSADESGSSSPSSPKYMALRRESESITEKLNGNNDEDAASTTTTSVATETDNATKQDKPKPSPKTTETAT